MTHHDDPEWEFTVEFELLGKGIDAETAERIVREAREHCAETNQAPVEAFGVPEEYAEEMARTRRSIAQRARWDYRHDIDVEDMWRFVVGSPGWILVLGGIVASLRNGIWTNLTPSGLAFAAAFCLTCSLAALGQMFRTSGRPRLMTAAWATTAAGVILAAMCSEFVSHDRVGRIPTVFLIATGAGLLWLGFRIKPPAGLISPKPGRITETEQWLRRLHGLLRHRHRVRRASARQVLAETRVKVEASGASPQEKFGDV
ncbi:hypothetical protein [Streptomyces sp. NPDC048639]|uniref:hypothetical protein n=1 Tax=Streptomyces sp. NPDC048639 TaxID=3365581 RepID=UPI003720EEA6